MNIVLAATDIDNDAEALRYAIIVMPSHGELVGLPPRLTYIPDENYYGNDSISFSVTDPARAVSNIAEVSIIVRAVNDRPKAYNQSVQTNENTPVQIMLIGSDVEDGVLTYEIVQPPAHGAIKGIPPAIRYFPNHDFSGSDSLLFRVRDREGSISNRAQVSIRVILVNGPPEAEKQSLQVNEDSSTTITFNASDPDGDRLEYNIVKGPKKGELSGFPPRLVYSPNPDYNGMDSVIFQATDPDGESDSATISIGVIPVNDPPVLAPIHPRVTFVGVPLTIRLEASDIDGDNLTYSVKKPPFGSSFDKNTGIFRWIPRIEGKYKIEFAVTDGKAQTVQQTTVYVR